MNLETLEVSLPPVARIVLEDAPDTIPVPNHLQGRRLLIGFRPLDDGEAGASCSPSVTKGEIPENPL
jgi:hypothetical protein